MSNDRQRKTTTDIGKVTTSNIVGVRFSDDVLRNLDAEVERRQKAMPWAEVTRVDVIREAVWILLHSEAATHTTEDNLSRPSLKLTLTPVPKVSSAGSCLVCSEALPKNHKSLCGKLDCKKALHRQRESERRKAAKA